MNDDVTILVGKCLNGHQASIGQLIERFRGQVFGLCYRMLRQREDAEDATQETFVRVVRHLHQFDPTRAFEPWLMTIAGNRCRTKLATRARRPNSVALDYPVEDQSVEQQRAELLKEEIELALDQVRPNFSQAFSMFHHRQMSYQEISGELNVPLGTVKTWVHRARQELITKLRQRGVLGG